jgi:hypothetical protein
MKVQDAFSIYHQTQESTDSKLQVPILPALGHAISGSTGTAISNLAIYPLGLIITRLQVQRTLRKSSAVPSSGEYKGVIDAFQQIYQNEGGLKAFYTGVVEDTGKSIADSFLFFLFYNFFRTKRLQRHGAKATTIPVIDELAVGMLAGACSKAFTTPISNVVTRKQTATMLSARSDSTSPSKELTVTQIMQQIREEKGIQGFWSGYSASLVLTLNPSITFFLYETLKRILLSRAERDSPGAGITFLMAAISKSIASTITYPFSLAKARAQTSSRPPIDAETRVEAEKVVDEFEHIHDEEEAKKTGKVVKKVVKRSTVFETVLRIYRTEGLEGLYEGVWGEIAKGFFSHGTTMLIKETVHKLIIQAYFLVLKALNKYPSPSQVVERAEHAVQDVGEKASEMMQGARESMVGVVGSAVESGKGAVDVVVERVVVVSSNAGEVAKNAGARIGEIEMLKSARETVGGKFEEIGQDIKPSPEKSGENE